jgi:uncharacterized protein YndB with AHSA1/START domain
MSEEQRDLATFDHRLAMRHVRVYPHPIERVFEAVTTAGHLNAWMLPGCIVERHLGGAWSFTFANPDPKRIVTGTIIAWQPPTLVDYGGMRFELEPTDGGTKLTFIHSFSPEYRDPIRDLNDPGDTLPGGPDTPWKPGFVAGWHLMLNDLDAYLGCRTFHPYEAGIVDPAWVALCKVYEDYIREKIPGGAPPAS